MKHCLLASALLIVCLVNISFQEKIAALIKEDWAEQGSLDQPVRSIRNPLEEQLREYAAMGIGFRLPAQVLLEEGNRGPYANILELIPNDSFENKLDVLFVGDSTISWGFDHTQFEQHSGLRTASLSFGLNVPDEDLANFVSLVAKCAMNDDGLIILSHSLRVLGQERGARPQDEDVRRISTTVDGCTALRRTLIGEPAAQSNLLTNRNRYDEEVLRGLEERLDPLNPLWSARIGWNDFSPDEDAAQGDDLLFLRWDPAFRVPYQREGFPSWRYRSLDLEQSRRGWSRMRSRIDSGSDSNEKRNLALWDHEHIGKTVCHILPITIRDESLRYWMWAEWTNSRCLLNYSDIVKDVYDIQSLEMESHHHYGNAGGLIMAAALGEHIKKHFSMLSSLRDQPPSDEIKSFRDSLFAR